MQWLYWYIVEFEICVIDFLWVWLDRRRRTKQNC